MLQKTRRTYKISELRKGRLRGVGQDGNREWITLMASGYIDGTSLPPTIIYQAVSGNLQNTWLVRSDPKEVCCFFASSRTGRTNEDLGFIWLTTMFDRVSKEKARLGRNWRLLFMDGHNSRVNWRHRWGEGAGQRGEWLGGYDDRDPWCSRPRRAAYVPGGDAE